MSRKHYIETARIIADEVERWTGNEHQRPATYWGAQAASNIARRLADQYAADNARFDRQRFYFACALDEQGRVQ